MRTIQIIRCNGLTDEDPFSANDPYVTIVNAATNEELFRTKVKEDGATTPTWKDAVFELLESFGDNEKLKFKVMDQDVASDDLLGETQEMDIAAATNEAKLPLTKTDGESAGSLFIKWVIEAAPEEEEKPKEDATTEDEEKPKEEEKTEPEAEEPKKEKEKEEETPAKEEVKEEEPQPQKAEPAPKAEPAEEQKTPKKEKKKSSPTKKKTPQKEEPHEQDETTHSNARSPSPGSREEVYSRLSNQPERFRNPSPLPPLVHSRAMSSEEEKTSITRLYTEAVERKQRNLVRLDRQLYGDSTGEKKTVDPDTLEGIVNRFYQGAKDHDSGIEKRRNTYFKKYAINVKRFADKDEEKTALDRLSNTAAKEKATADHLFEKFNPPRTFARRTRDEIDSNAKRYFDGGFAKRH